MSKILITTFLTLNLINGFSELEEKVGQILMVHFHGTEANDEAKILIEKAHVGGFIYYNWANDLQDPSQVFSLSKSLQKLAKVPLFIAVDQEGGKVTRLTNGFTQIPSNRKLAEIGDLQLVHNLAFSMGKEMRSVGINMNFAPVVDVDIENSVIAERSYGNDPIMVSAFAKKSIEGYKRGKIISVLKHFPGCGAIKTDPHEDLPVVDLSFDQLQKVDLFPYQELSSCVDVIMTAHILALAIDNNTCATFSKKTLDYLKNDIGYKGLIISDSLIMEAALKKYHTIEEAAIAAFEAGCDILLLGGKLLNGEKDGYELKPNQVLMIHQALVNAVKSGRITEDRLHESVNKIMQLKKKCFE